MLPLLAGSQASLSGEFHGILTALKLASTPHPGQQDLISLKPGVSGSLPPPPAWQTAQDQVLVF